VYSAVKKLFKNEMFEVIIYYAWLFFKKIRKKKIWKGEKISEWVNNLDEWKDVNGE
jgi:hypothetical protein